MIKTPKDHLTELANACFIDEGEALNALKTHSTNYVSEKAHFEPMLYEAHPETADQLLEIETMALLHRWASNGGFDSLCKKTGETIARQKKLFERVRMTAEEARLYMTAKGVIKDDGSNPYSRLTHDAELRLIDSCSLYLIRQPWPAETVYTGWMNLGDLALLRRIFDTTRNGSLLEIVEYGGKLWLLINECKDAAAEAILFQMMKTRFRKADWESRTSVPGMDGAAIMMPFDKLGEWHESHTTEELLAWNDGTAENWWTKYLLPVQIRRIES